MNGIAVKMHAINSIKKEKKRKRNFKNGVVIDSPLLSLLQSLTDFVSVLDT